MLEALEAELLEELLADPAEDLDGALDAEPVLDEVLEALEVELLEELLADPAEDLDGVLALELVPKIDWRTRAI